MLSIKTQKVLNKSTRFKIISKSAFTSFDEEFDKMVDLIEWFPQGEKSSE